MIHSKLSRTKFLFSRDLIPLALFLSGWLTSSIQAGHKNKQENSQKDGRETCSRFIEETRFLYAVGAGHLPQAEKNSMALKHPSIYRLLLESYFEASQITNWSHYPADGFDSPTSLIYNFQLIPELLEERLDFLQKIRSTIFDRDDLKAFAHAIEESIQRQTNSFNLLIGLFGEAQLGPKFQLEHASSSVVREIAIPNVFKEQSLEFYMRPMKNRSNEEKRNLLISLIERCDSRIQSDIFELIVAANYSGVVGVGAHSPRVFREKFGIYLPEHRHQLDYQFELDVIRVSPKGAIEIIEAKDNVFRRSPSLLNNTPATINPSRLRKYRAQGARIGRLWGYSRETLSQLRASKYHMGRIIYVHSFVPEEDVTAAFQHSTSNGINENWNGQDAENSIHFQTFFWPASRD